ncbi:nitrate- and nitrite sensing domain-containing protein [Streptacidiphilus sp. PAMC 29251]
MIAPATIRAKLVRILVIALALVLALLGVVAAQQVTSYRQASSTVQEVKLLIALQNFVHEHQKERGLTDGVISGTTSFWAQMPAQRAATDTTLAAVKALIAGKTDSASDQVRNGLQAVDQLPAIRQAADNGHGNLLKTYAYFTVTNKELTALTLGLEKAQDPALHADIQALLSLGTAKEDTGEERALMTGSLPLGHFPSDWYTEFTVARAGRLANLDTLRLWATPNVAWLGRGGEVFECS